MIGKAQTTYRQKKIGQFERERQDDSLISIFSNGYVSIKYLPILPLRNVVSRPKTTRFAYVL